MKVRGIQTDINMQSLVISITKPSLKAISVCLNTSQHLTFFNEIIQVEFCLLNTEWTR